MTPTSAEYASAPRDPHGGALDGWRIRRSRADRKLGGVCAGVARHFDLDPTVVRVLAAVLVLAGGAGLVLYAAGWLLLPADGEQRGPLGRLLTPRRDDAGLRKVGLGAAVVVAGLLLLSSLGWSSPFLGTSVPLLVLVVVVLAVLLRDTSPPADAPPSSAAPTAADDHPSADGGRSEDTAILPYDAALPPSPQEDVGFPSGSYAVPPVPPVPSVPPGVGPAPRRRGRDIRGGTALLVAAIGSVVVGCGVLWLVDLSGHPVHVPSYLALALAVVGTAALVGTIRGNGRWLLLPGVVLGLALAVSSQVTSWSTGVIEQRPSRAADLHSAYRLGAGRLTLDLTRIRDLPALDGRSVHISDDVGRVEVLVPPGLAVSVDAHTRAGVIDLFGREESGTDVTQSLASPSGSQPSLALIVDQHAGQTTVEHR